MSDHRHLTADLIRAVDLGDAPLRPILEAVKTECPRCWRTLVAYLEDSDLAPGVLDAVWNRCRRRIRELHPRVQAEACSAEMVVQDLGLLSGRDRQRRLVAGEYASPESADPRFPDRALVERLLGETRSNLPDRPETALEWATAALIVLDRQPDPPADPRALALAHRANAYRAGSADLPAAARGIARARRLLDEAGDADLDTLAELDSLEASLLIALRRFQEAQHLLERALLIYQELGQVTLAARTLIQIGHVFSTVGAVAAAESPYRAALQTLSPHREPELYLAARLNLAHTLFELGRVDAARDVIAYDEDLFERHADGHTQLRRTWLLGRIADATGDPEEAEELLSAVRDAFATRADGFDAALVALDLWGVHVHAPADAHRALC